MLEIVLCTWKSILVSDFFIINVDVIIGKRDDPSKIKHRGDSGSHTFGKSWDNKIKQVLYATVVLQIEGIEHAVLVLTC